jgi:zinc D-Ala-D-Ala carboxypeptidase
MQLAPNFFLREFLKSEVASRIGRAVVATQEIINNLVRVAAVLQNVRDEIKEVFKVERPFSITSGYRPLWLNKLVKGAKNSDHLEGRAADFEVMGMSNYDICKFIEQRISLYNIDKLIYEFGDWVHISVPKIGEEPRRQVMTAVYNPKTKKVEYPLGIHKQEEN